MSYGICYQGSKNKIAKEIIRALPAGRRLVDLFGGGFAISHCALLSGKWDKVLYNDINPLLGPLIRDAIAGHYNYENFTPEFISRDKFHAEKMSDGYIKWIWSFGGNGWDYIYSYKDEENKRRAHEEYFSGKRANVTIRLDHVERLERLQKLSALAGLPLEMTNADYREYKYQDGDIVYCDIPYQNAADTRLYKQYNLKFDHGAFYEWAVTAPFPVYFSSYKLGGIVWERDVTGTMCVKNNNTRREVLYCVDDYFTPPGQFYQGHLFT